MSLHGPAEHSRTEGKIPSYIGCIGTRKSAWMRQSPVLIHGAGKDSDTPGKAFFPGIPTDSQDLEKK